MEKGSLSVSYLKVYQNWIRNDRRRNNGESTIPITGILTNLQIETLLKQDEYETVCNETTAGDKIIKLFNVYMPGRGEEGFKQVVDYLYKSKYDPLANDLIEELNRECNTNSTFSVQNPRILQAQEHLSYLIKENVDFIAKYWSDVIRVAKTEAAFVQVQVLEHFKSENGNPVDSYRKVFDDKDGKTIHKRILIQADPGCGKTTYVNKLALDWANGDEYLRKKFDFIFLIALQTLTMDVLDAIKWFLPDESEQFFASYAKSRDSKILLILDGFDEVVENSEWYSSVMEILKGQSKQFQFFHLIVTTRRSHVDKIPQQLRERSLLINGFNEESMKQFLDKQGAPLPSVGQQSNLSHLLQTPLFCAIYCSLHFGGGDPIELEDSYDLIKALVENSITNTLKKKTVANEEEQLDEIGKFAFQMLDSKSLNFLKKFCRSFEVIKPSFDLTRVNLDLLIKRRIPNRGVGRFQEEFSFPHQLIAEYLSAKYFARSLTKKQLKQPNGSTFIHNFYNRVFDIPFVRFFLFELLFLYLEKKYEKNAFDNLLNIPGFRFIWNIKSKTGIRTLDNVRNLYFNVWPGELRNHSRFIPTLFKCRNLSSLNLSDCGLSKHQVEQLVNCIYNNCFQKRIQLHLSLNENVGSTPQLFRALTNCKHLQLLHLQKCEMTVESTNELARCIDNNGMADLKDLHLGESGNVGSTPQLFTALSKCKHLQVLNLHKCKLTVESTTELARCIDNNGMADLKYLHLGESGNVGSSTHLFHVLHKCQQLKSLNLNTCSMTEESWNIFLSTFNSNTFQQLLEIWLRRNRKIKVDDNFFVAFEKCPKISNCDLSKSTERDLSEVGRKAKETLEQRGCRFWFDFV